MKNVTVKLSDEAAERIRVYAAERRTSVSRALGAVNEAISARPRSRPSRMRP